MNIYAKFFTGEADYFPEILDKLSDELDADKVGATVETTGETGLLGNPRKTYSDLQNYTELDLSPLLYQADVHQDLLQEDVSDSEIDWCEDEFGDPWLSTYLSAARETYYSEYTHEEKVRLVVNTFKLYINLFDEFQPDVFVADDIGSFTTLIPFYLVQNKYNGTSVWWHWTRIGDRYALKHNPLDKFELIQKRFVKRKNDETDIDPQYTAKANEYIENFRKEVLDSDNTDSTSLSSDLPGFVRTAYKTYEYWRLYNLSGHRDDFKLKPTHKMIQKKVLSGFRRRHIDKIAQRAVPDEQYIFFPLHFQPEWSTLVLAPTFTNQVGLIRQISKNIPATHKLCVKEHPKMYHRDPGSRGFYEQIASIDNTILVHPEVDSQVLIDNADAVTTITGTAGFEACLLETPVLVFAQPSYSIMDNILTIDNQANLSEAVYKALYSHEIDTEETVKYIESVYEESFYFDYGAMDSRDLQQTCIDNVVANLAEDVKKKQEMDIPEV